MKTAIMNLIVVTALSFGGTALAAEAKVGKVQPPAAKPAASAVPPAPASAPQPAAKPSAPQPAAKPSAPAGKPSAPGKPAAKLSAPGKPSQGQPASSKPAQAELPRSKSLDLRHCLDLKTDAEIAKCAGE